MTDEDRDNTVGWLREPPGAGEIRVLVECGDEAELSPSARDALERFMNELNDSEVEGYRLGGSFGPTMNVFGRISLEGNCGKLRCDKNDCGSLNCGSYTGN